jgi:hypothetical protein
MCETARRQGWPTVTPSSCTTSRCPGPGGGGMATPRRSPPAQRRCVRVGGVVPRHASCRIEAPCSPYASDCRRCRYPRRPNNVCRQAQQRGGVAMPCLSIPWPGAAMWCRVCVCVCVCACVWMMVTPRSTDKRASGPTDNTQEQRLPQGSSGVALRGRAAHGVSPELLTTWVQAARRLLGRGGGAAASASSSHAQRPLPRLLIGEVVEEARCSSPARHRTAAVPHPTHVGIVGRSAASQPALSRGVQPTRRAIRVPGMSRRRRRRGRSPGLRCGGRCEPTGRIIESACSPSASGCRWC